LKVAAVDGSAPSTLDDLVVHFSRCALSAAMVGTARPEPIIERSWLEAVDGR
jgi:hypothetical protein